MPQVPSNPRVSRPWLLLSAVGCQPTAPKCLKYPPNPRVSRPWLLLSAVGCQPTAPKCLKYPPNPRVSRPWLLLSAETPGFANLLEAFWGCRLATYSLKSNHRVSRPWLLLSAVGCQPTAQNASSSLQLQGFKPSMVAFKCCRLPTYSPKMPQVPSNSSISSILGL